MSRLTVCFFLCSLGLTGCIVLPGDDVLGRPPVPPIPPVGIDWGNRPMLDDPETSPETWTDYVFADDHQQALRRCQGRAIHYGWVRLTAVRQVGKNRYECVFRTVG